MAVGGVELATGYVSLAVSTRGVGAQINQVFSEAALAADKHGSVAGERFATGVGTGAKSKRGGGVADYFFSPALNIAAEKGGAGTGRAFATGVTRAITGGVMTSVGASIGSALTNAAGAKLKSLAPKMFGGLSGGAAKAGSAAGGQVVDGIQKKTHRMSWSNLSRGKKLAIAAVAAGVFFGTRMGNSAEKQAARSFQPHRIFGGLKLGALAAGTAVAGVLGTAIAKGGARLEAIDSAQAKLSGLGHSAKEVTTIMDSALASVKGTAFGLDEAATIAASAVAAGIKPGKELERTLKLTADAATIGGSSMNEMGAIFNKVATSNKVYNDTLNQLGDRGIPIVQLLAKEMGVSAGEVTKLASKGKIDFKTFQNAMEAGLGGAALSSGNTFKGALKNAGAALSRFGAGLLKGAFPQLKGVFGGVTKGLDALTPLATRVGAKIGVVFSDLVRIARGLAPVFVSVGKLIGGAFKPFIKGLGGGQSALKSLGDWVNTHQADLTQFFISLGHAAIGFGKIVATVVVGAIEGIRWLNKAVGVVLRGILGVFANVTRNIADVIRPFNKEMADSLDGVANKFDVMSANSEAKAKKIDEGLGKVSKGIKDKLLPALDKADAGLTKIGKTELDKAKLRDSTARLSTSIKGIGTATNGAQIHLKKFSDITKLGANEQKALKARIHDSRVALADQLKAVKAAGGGQKDLTKAWETGKKRLYEEFKQMGLSNKEAKKLADRYAGIKPKVSTKFEAPGLTTVSNDVHTLDQRVRNIKNRNALLKIDVSTNAGTVARSLGMSKANLLQNFAGGGTFGVLPGYTPGKDVHKFVSPTGGELNLSGGEGIMRPEWVKAIGGPEEVKRQNLAARRGKLRRGPEVENNFSGGGVWEARIRVPGDGTGSAVVPKTFANRANTKAYDAAASWGSTVERALIQVLKAGLAKKKAAEAAKAGGGNGGYSGPVGAGAAGIRALANHFHPSYIAGHRDPQGGPAFDIGSSGKKNTNIGNAMRANHAKLGLRYVIRQMQITSAKNGWKGWRAYHPITGAGDFRHVAHVHVSYANGGVLRLSPVAQQHDPMAEMLAKQMGIRTKKFDSGGYLEPGATLAVNHTGKRERVRTAEQEAAAQAAPLVGSLTLVSAGRVNEDMDTVLYKLRTFRRGGNG